MSPWAQVPQRPSKHPTALDSDQTKVLRAGGAKAILLALALTAVGFVGGLLEGDERRLSERGLDAHGLRADFEKQRGQAPGLPHCLLLFCEGLRDLSLAAGCGNDTGNYPSESV